MSSLVLDIIYIHLIFFERERVRENAHVCMREVVGKGRARGKEREY